MEVFIMFKIGEFSKLAHVSVRMLRHYDKLDLLVPQTVDESSSYRYYSAVQLQTVNKIQKLRELGFSLSLIKEMIEPTSDISNLKNYFTLREQELKEEQEKLAKQSSLLESAALILKEDFEKMNYHTILKEIPERTVISTRKIIPNYMSEGILWQTLGAELGCQKVQIASVPYGMAIFHDTEYKEQDVDVEIQMAVQGNYQDTDEVIFKTAPSVNIASITFSGSYEQMGKVTETAARWIEDNDLKLDGPMFNIYHVSPAQDPNPENWITEACFPVKNQK